MNEICIIFQRIDCNDLIRYMEQTSVLDFLHKNLSCREFLIFKLVNEFEMELKEIVDMETSKGGVPKGDMKNLIVFFKFTTTQKWLKNFGINRTINDLINLQDLYLYNNKIVDISPLQNLTNLQTLNLSHNKIVDVTSLQNLTNLQKLWLFDNKIVDVSSLRNLVNLQCLDLSDNKIVDVASLQNLTNLQTLYLDHNEIVDVSPLQNLTNLQNLFLHNNQIINQISLKGLTKTTIHF